MYRSSVHVVGAGAYQVGDSPYQMDLVTAAALRELKQRRAAEAKPKEAPKPFVDPEAAAQREEAGRLMAEARGKMKAAKAEADRVVAEARSEAEKLRSRGHEEGYSAGLSQGSEAGYEEGLKKGEDEGLGRWAELVARWQGLLDATLLEKQRYFSDRERILVELVMKVSAKVLVHEVKLNPAGIQARVQEAIKKASDRSNLVVRLNPDDIAKALEADSASFRTLGGVKQIEYLADEKIVKGGVRLESSTETIDAGLDTQLTELVRGLLQEAYHAD